MVTDRKMGATTKIDENLIPLINKAIPKVKDQFGLQKYKNKKDFVDAAVKELLLRESIVVEVPVS
jgi:hypothetical protein